MEFLLESGRIDAALAQVYRNPLDREAGVRGAGSRSYHYAFAARSRGLNHPQDK
jgi:hypothetical protein